MKKQVFKFAVQSAKFGNAKIVNIKATSADEAISLLWNQKQKLFLTYTILISPEHQVVTDFNFDYNSDVYKNYINSL